MVRAGTASYRLGHFIWSTITIWMASGGRELGFAFYDRKGATWLFPFRAAAWQCQVRIVFLIGVPGSVRSNCRVSQQHAFFNFALGGVKHLASHVLGQVAHRISADWQQKYGHGLGWLETFVDTERYSGACYRAATWRYVAKPPVAPAKTATSA